MSTKRAFTLIEALVALWIFSLSLNAFNLYFQALNHLKSSNIQRQNNIGLYQLRRVISLGLEHHVNDDELCMNYHAEETCFYEYEGFLMQEPGTQYYLIKVEGIYFTLEDQRILIHYKCEEKEYDEWIGWLNP